MYKQARQRLRRLIDLKHSHLMRNSLIGVEKETLRVNKQGGIAQTPHPARSVSDTSRPRGSPSTSTYGAPVSLFGTATRAKVETSTSHPRVVSTACLAVSRRTRYSVRRFV